MVVTGTVFFHFEVIELPYQLLSSPRGGQLRRTSPWETTPEVKAPSMVHVNLCVFPYLLAWTLEFVEPIFESEAKGEKNLLDGFFPPSFSQRLRLPTAHGPFWCAATTFAAYTRVASNWWQFLVVQETEIFGMLPHLLFLSSPNGIKCVGFFLFGRLHFWIELEYNPKILEQTLKLHMGVQRRVSELVGCPPAAWFSYNRPFPRNLLGGGPLFWDHPTPVNPWSGRGTFRAITPWHACSTLFIFTRAHLTAFLLTLTVANAFRWTYERLMEKRILIILNFLNSPYWCDYQPFFFNNSTLLLISWNLALKLLLTQLVILFDTILILAGSCCAPRRTTSASKNSSADYGNFKLKVGQVFWRLTSGTSLRSEDDISEIHQIMVLHPPQKRELLHTFTKNWFNPLWPISHNFKGKTHGMGPQNEGGFPKHHGEVLPSIGTTSPRHIVKMPHNPPGWCIFTGASREDPSWMVFFTNQMEILRHVGNLINHLILHPHPIYEQSISTNSFPASNTA